MFFKHRVMFAVSLLNRFLKPMVLRPSVASSGVSQLVFVLQPMVLRPLVASHNWHARLKGLCDKNGCDIQLNRLGQTNFFGPGADFQIDSTKPITVITQFITSDGTDSGKLTEVKVLPSEWHDY